MDPKTTHPSKIPADEALHAHPPRPFVRRLNPKAIFILLGVVGLVLVGRMIFKMTGDASPHSRENNANTSHYRPSEDMLERGPFGLLPGGYGFLTPTPKPPAPVIEPDEPAEIEPEPDPETLRRLERLRQELVLAMDSPIRFKQSGPQTGPPPQQGSNTNSNVTPTAGIHVAGGASALTGDGRSRAFFAEAAGVQTHVARGLEAPWSPYEIKAGTIIPAALVTPINSDLPGDVIGQVTAHVYDSVSGRFLLVPQGTRLIGRYSSEVLNGQNRVLVAWQRLILPNGNSIVLEAMPGTDAAGVAGLAGHVDYHFDRLAAATVLSTLISLGGNLAASTDRESAQLNVVGTTVAQQASGVGQRIIDRELDLKPTILIRAGTAFNVLVNRDLILAPRESVSNQR